MILFIIYFIIWALLSWPVDIQHFITGVCVSILVTFLTSGLFIGKPGNFKEIKRYAWFFIYVAVLTCEYIKGSLLTVWNIFRPGLSGSSSISKIETSLKSGMGITFLANSIIFMPGTFCIDADSEKGVLYVHYYCAGNRQGIDKVTKDRIYKFESILKKVFE